ncbi:hypothetical protein F2Q69_00032789 [Brassica cretica]|uniref:Filament-like plant protein n=1 Tax=Brassica cretica TaxID=69181 RepID=A0A8S9SRT6_BRACR|nr:hypothetical protein F2Q69_00032789 [Brassica cretica]
MKSQLTSSRDLQSLAETQLKCVTESYKTLELHANELEANVKRLEEETERLERAFSTEKRGHEETLAKCKDLQEEMQRNETCKGLASKSQPNKEKDIASATEKLAACQETIHLLSQQLQSLQPQSNRIPKSQSPEKKTSEATPNFAEDDLPHDHNNIQPSHSFRHTVNPTVHAIIKSSSVSSSSREDVADETHEKHVLSSQDKKVEDSESNPLEDTYAKTEDDSSCKSLLKEVELEKEKIELELTRCLENLESAKLELEEKEKLISEMKWQLTSSRDLQSLAETQLKCVTESYKTLELHAKELEANVKRLEEETERLERAFSTEKRGHEETLAKCKDLQEEMQRNETCRKGSASKSQPNQEKDIASATEKLAACQETIHLLSQQLQSLQPQSNHIPNTQSPEKKIQHHKASEATPNSGQDDLPHDHNNIQPSHSFRHTVNPTVHAIIKSSSVSSSSREDGEKHTRGLGRFFSSKSKNNGR